MLEDASAFRAALQQGLGEGVRRFVVVGGDGTMSLAAQELSGTSGVLIPYPAGTGNTFAWSLEIPRNLERWKAMVERGWVRSIDVGVVEAGGEARIFLNTATIGVTSQLVGLIKAHDRRRYGLGAWLVHLGRAVQASPLIESSVLFHDGNQNRFSTRQLVIVNGAGLAGPIRMGPGHALAHDGILEIFSVGDQTARSMMRVAFGIVMARHRHDPSAHYGCARGFDVYTRPALAMDVDGEAWHCTPARFTVKPLALRVMAPWR
jgi:diacylglycerol kinase family enzyme